jgi:uncharacterized membrane protein affecting hemolysin expression
MDVMLPVLMAIKPIMRLRMIFVMLPRLTAIIVLGVIKPLFKILMQTNQYFSTGVEQEKNGSLGCFTHILIVT